MKFSKIAALAVIAAAVMSSCSEDDYWDKGAGTGAASGNTITTDGTISFSETFKPGADGTYDIPDPLYSLGIRRGTNSAAETVALKVVQYEKDQQGEFKVTQNNDWAVPASVTFAAGESEVNIPVRLVTRAVGSYRVVITAEGNVAIGGKNSWTCEATISGATPDPVWESMGKGKYTNGYFFENAYEVEVQKDVAAYDEDQLGYYGHYRLVQPLTEGFEAEGYVADGLVQGTPPEYVEFYVIQPGGEIPNTAPVVKVPDGDTYYLYIRGFATGFYHPSYGAEILSMYGANLSNSTIADFAGQIVLAWAEEPSASKPQGSLGAISMGTYLYMSGIGGWDYMKNTKDFQFVFPGFSLGDFSFSLAYSGVFTTKDGIENVEGTADITGKDVAYVYVGMVETNSAAEALQKVGEAIEKVDAEGNSTTDVPLVKLDKSGSFRFAVDHTGTYTLAAYSFNADGESQETATAVVHFTSQYDVEQEDPDWKTIGTGEYTDGILASLFNGPGVLSWSVEVQQHKTETGRYRVVNPYGANCPWNEPDEVSPKKFYMEIDATNPRCLYIPSFELGLTWDESAAGGHIWAASLSYIFKQQGATDEELISMGAAGTLEDGVMTMPAPLANGNTALLWTAPDNPDREGKWYLLSEAENFMLVLPDAGTAAKAKVHPKKVTSVKGAVKHGAFKARAARKYVAKAQASKAGRHGVAMMKGAGAAKQFRVPMAL